PRQHTCRFLSTRLRPPPRPTLFPYTTLFRSMQHTPHRSRTEPGRLPAALAAELAGLGIDPDGLLRLIRTALDEDLAGGQDVTSRSEEHTSELQSRENLVCRLLLEKKNIIHTL